MRSITWYQLRDKFVDLRLVCLSPSWKLVTWI